MRRKSQIKFISIANQTNWSINPQCVNRITYQFGLTLSRFSSFYRVFVLLAIPLCLRADQDDKDDDESRPTKLAKHKSFSPNQLCNHLVLSAVDRSDHSLLQATPSERLLALSSLRSLSSNNRAENDIPNRFCHSAIGVYRILDRHPFRLSHMGIMDTSVRSSNQDILLNRNELRNSWIYLQFDSSTF